MNADRPAFDQLLDFMKQHIPKDEWKEFLILLDKFDTECRRDIIHYALSNGYMRDEFK